MEEVPCRTSLAPLAFPRFVLCLLRVEREGLLDYRGRAGIISIVQWNLRPVIFGVDSRKPRNGPEIPQEFPLNSYELQQQSH